jgi:DNA polymerase-1
LQRLAQNGKSDVAQLLEYRKVNKILTAFLPTYRELVTSEGLIHSNFNPDGTRTGRLSSSDPNWQQVPKQLKHLIKPARPGQKFVTFDLSAIEPVVLAKFSEDEALCKLILSGKSFHSNNAKSMFALPCSVDEVATLYSDKRRLAKTIGLAILYGAGWKQVQLAGKKEGVMFEEKECRAIVANLRETYSGVWQYKKNLDKQLEAGEVLYNLFGRPLRIDDPEDVYMKGLNSLVQSSASDLCLQIAQDIQDKGYGIPVLFVHDSITTAVNDASAEAGIKRQFEKYVFKTKWGDIRVACEGGVSEALE